MNRDEVTAEARKLAAGDLDWLVDLGVFGTPFDEGEREAVFESAEAAFGVDGDPDEQRRNHVRTALDRRDCAFSFSYDCILGYEGYGELIEEFRRIADGHLDDLEYEIGGDWAEGEDPALHLTLGDAVFEPDLTHMGDAVDSPFYEVMDDVLAATGAERSFEWLVSDTVSLVAFVGERQAAALRAYFDDPEARLPPAALSDDAALIDHLDHDDAGVRRAAATMAVDIDATAAIPAIEDLLYDDPDPAVKAACVDALAAFGGDRDVEVDDEDGGSDGADDPGALVRSAFRDALGAEDDEIRRLAFEAVAGSGGRFRRDLLPDGDARVRQHVLTAMEAEDDDIRRLAFEVAEVGSARPHKTIPLDADAVREHVRRGLRESDPAIREHAVSLAIARGTTLHTDTLLAALAESDGRETGTLIKALGRTGDEAAVPRLVELLGSDLSTRVRSAAARSLGQLGTPDARQALAETLDDSEFLVREAAYRGLASAPPGVELVDPPAAADGIPAVIDEKRGSNVAFSRESLSVVGQLDTPAAVDHLVAATESDIDSIRAYAAEWLAHRPGDEAVAALATLVRNHEGELDSTVEYALRGLDESDHPVAEETVEWAEGREGIPDWRDEPDRLTPLGAVIGLVAWALLLLLHPVVAGFYASQQAIVSRSPLAGLRRLFAELADEPVASVAGFVLWWLLLEAAQSLFATATQWL